MLSCGLSVAQSSLSPDYSFAGKLFGARGCCACTVQAGSIVDDDRALANVH